VPLRLFKSNGCLGKKLSSHSCAAYFLIYAKSTIDKHEVLEHGGLL